MPKIQTLAEMEAESLDGFRNPVRTPEEEARSEALRQAKKADEQARAHRFTLTDEESKADAESQEDDEGEDVDGN